jgi:hypothetical protein
MKRADGIVIAAVLLLLLPFFIFDSPYLIYKELNAGHPLALAAMKFGMLATFGEMLAARIKTGIYCKKGFGLIPRMIVWGLLGIWIAFAMKTFAAGVPAVLEKIGLYGAEQTMKEDLSFTRFFVSFCISVAMNTGFAPVFMTLHKITDMHIAQYKGSLRCLISPIRFRQLLSGLNWDVQWNFVFKKTIPFFWIPAHTVTFILSEDFQVLFAALLSVALGLILAFASRKG